MTTPAKASRSDTPLALCAVFLALVLGVVISPMFSLEARAEMVSSSDHLVTMTAQGGNEDLLFVLDNRTEKLMIYRVTNQSAAELMQLVELPSLFDAARARRAGD